jgi:protein-S-isoprenylcysteine O-methyltransferase Ste14
VVAVVGVHTTYAAAPVAELAFGVKRLFHGGWLAGAGAAVASCALFVTLWSQSSMGDSLRIGVDPTERTTLVTSGPFRWVRNPIYSAMITYVVGTAMLVPNFVGMLAVAALIAGVELQVRRVEEPYLGSVHGNEYYRYAAHVGRLLPRIGRFGTPSNG